MIKTFETQRCMLGPVCEEDRDDVFALYQNEVVRKYLGGTIGRTDFDTMFDRLLINEASSNWIIRSKARKAFVGSISIGKHHDGRDMELSYQFLPDYWGKGLAFETLTAVLEFVARTLSLKSIIAETQAANTASRKLLEQLEMSLERTLFRFGENQVIYRKQIKKTD